jgi:hypothetical protein
VALGEEEGMDNADREPGPLPGTMPGQKPPPESGDVRSYGWQWGRDEDRQPELPWIGIFLVVLGGLLLLDRALPEYVSIGNVIVLAAGLAFLLLWVLRKSTFMLYAGAFLTAAAVPNLVESLLARELDGLGTLSYGVAFLFIAAVRMSRGGGLGWQALIGGLLAALGASQLALPGAVSLVLPALLVVLGIILLTRGRAT